MKVQARFLVESVVTVPLDIDLDKFHEWMDDPEIELTPSLALAFLERKPDFPTAEVVIAIKAWTPDSWVTNLMYVEVHNE